MSQKKEEKKFNIENQLKQDMASFDTQIKQMIGAKNYAQFLLVEIEKDKKEKNGT